ncbi:hypothetical protein HYH02_011406 [Chlamydomonas schloesseri]|uniref:Alpha-1,3-glucosyltransferase n=1 Tax=Chlamydomonas schloesseri TaxID=2026947 RepID=A0A835T181_9CHLO|nr:hypothetical protein HYH02_011406 [Chlamydomonas schloesseri]|eukprot:KAG2436974.1 hypothetical protein HYH02_011406 [Chlamydomonas schloesseri]
MVIKHGSIGVLCLQLAVVATAVKLLLLPTYCSTDFEVHRNWLAITHSLPISQWYVDATSVWTLDYPPLFAWFEWALSQAAAAVEPAMLVVANLGHDSAATVAFQRGSVVVTDLMLLLAAYWLARDVAALSMGRNSGGGGFSGPANGGSGVRAPPPRSASFSGLPADSRSSAAALAGRRGVALFGLLALNAGLLLVDHIHFQYNGIMLGVLLLSLAAARTGRHLLSGFLFAVLLNMKHLFLHAAPAYFVYLLRHYCFETTADSSSSSSSSSSSDGSGNAGRGIWVTHGLTRLTLLGAAVVAVFGASFGPFLALGQIPQVLSRLFPFGRGLLHAYWAANAWAPYAAADKLLALAAPALNRRLGWAALRVDMAAAAGSANLAGGLVKVQRFAVLPQITPPITAAAVLLALLPCLVGLWRLGRAAGRVAVGPGALPASSRQHVRRVFARALAYSCLCGFVFGWHVHEKAVIVALLPLAVDAVCSRLAARRFLVLSTAGHYGLLPLLFRPEEYGTKILLVLSYFSGAAVALGALHGDAASPHARAAKARGKRNVGLALGWLQRAYLAGFIAVELYCSVVHERVPALRERLPFAPLMLTSVYCSLGVLGVWGDMALEWAGEAAGHPSRSSFDADI